MSAVEVPVTVWRCDADGETFTVTGTIVARDADGDRVDPPPSLDVIIDAVPCPICGDGMRRIVGLLDFRDWEAQFS